MKKLLILTLAAVLSVPAMADNPLKGDIIVDAALGVGSVAHAGDDARAQFTQRASVEWCVTDKLFGKPEMALGIGLAFNNQFGGTVHWGKFSSATRDDISFVPTATLHYDLTDRIDTYGAVGVGIAVMNHSSAVAYSDEFPGGIYADEGLFCHTSGRSSAAFAMSLYAGMRYYFTDSWAVEAQVGLINAAIKKSYGNSYNFLTIGAAYSF